MGTGSVFESSKRFSTLMPKKILIKFYHHKTSKHVSADVLDSEEGHQRTMTSSVIWRMITQECLGFP